jgi:iron complex outermembrane receptor protein
MLTTASLAPCALYLALGPFNEARSQDAKPMAGMNMEQTPAAPAAQGEVGNNLQVQDVVVNSSDPGEQKMMEVMMETPRSGDAVTGTQAQEQQFTTLTDFSEKVPGYRPNITSPHYSRMAIRGLGTSSSGTGVGTQSETGFVVDNVPWIQPEWTLGDWTGISSFEIGYGPMGTAGGKNTDVGAIFITTQLPSFVPKAQIETSFGNYNHIIEKVSATGPVLDDRLAYRFDAYFDKAKGWIHDGGTGQDYLNTSREGGRLQLLGVGDGFTDRLIFNFNATDEYAAYGEGTSATAVIGDSFLVYANGTKPATTYFQTIAARLGKPILTINPYVPFLGRDGPDPALSTTLSNELNWQLGANTLTSISAFGYAASRMYDFSDSEGLSIGNGTGNMDTYIIQTSQEFRLSSPKNQKLEWVVGLYSLYEDAWNKMHHWEAGTDTANWLNNPAAVPGLANWFDTAARDFQIAAFGQGTYHFDDQASLTLGLRDSYDIRYGSTTYVPIFVPNTPYSYAQQLSALIAMGGGGAGSTGGHSNYHNGLTATINPEFKLNEHVLFYSLIGHGDKTAAVNTSAAPIYSNGVFQRYTPVFTKPTTSWDYEIGAKTNWFDGSVISNINFYWNDLWNFQTSQVQPYILPNGDTAFTSFLSNAPHVRLRGVELIERWAPPFIPGLELHATGAYNEGRYVSYPGAPPPTDETFKGGPSSVDESNTRFAGIPWWTFNVGVNYEHPVGALFRGLAEKLHDNDGWGNAPFTAFGYVNVDWFNHTELTDPRAVYQYWQPAYSLVNLGIGLRTDDRNYSLTLWAKNLFDAQPFNAFSVGSATTAAAVSLTTQGPRFFGATLLVTL